MARLASSRWFTAALLLLLFASPARADIAGSREALLARYRTLEPGMATGPFNRRLHLASIENSGLLVGDIHAVIEHRFSQAAGVLAQQGEWCGILTLHLNVKFCGVTSTGSPGLTLYVGRKFFQPIEDAYRLDFAFRAMPSADYLRVELDAARGPFGTRDYRIVLEASPLDATRTLLHFSYAYAHGFAARFAMQAYLSTFGNDKVGFTVVGTRDGRPAYVEGVRGVLERNAMRYYLAIETYFDALALPPSARLERRLADWFDATERYALQLHELERDEYLTMKRAEFRRQRDAGGSASGQSGLAPMQDDVGEQKQRG